MNHTDSASVVAHTDSADSHNREVDTRSLDELEDEIAELCTHIDAATYRLLRAIAEFDRREACGWGFQSTAHWLTWKVGIDMVTAREKVRVARALENLPQISETFRQGKVSYSKVRAMTRIATPDNECYLLSVAENGTATDVESLVRAHRTASRGEDLEEARRHRQERYLDMYTDEDGMVVIRGRLPQEVAALVEKALEAAMDALRQEESPAPSVIPAKPAPAVFRRGAGIPQPRIDVDSSYDSAEASEGSGQAHLHDSAEASPTSAMPADAGIPSLRVAVAPSGDSAESWRREDYAQRRVDALSLVAEAALGKGLGQTERGEPYQVMIHVDSDVLADRSHDGRADLDNGEGVPAESCRRLACDAPHVAVTQDKEGNILNIGRKARKISKPLWRALASRDRTCRFPGCARNRHLQAHHIEHWAKGGETNPDNTVLLCKHHHWAVHEGGVRVEGRPPGGLVFHRPDGRLLPTCPVPVPINGKAGETLKEANRRHGLELTSKTVDCFWDGERMDLHMAVDALITYDDDPVDEE